MDESRKAADDMLVKMAGDMMVMDGVICALMASHPDPQVLRDTVHRQMAALRSHISTQQVALGATSANPPDIDRNVSRWLAYTDELAEK